MTFVYAVRHAHLPHALRWRWAWRTAPLRLDSTRHRQAHGQTRTLPFRCYKRRARTCSRARRWTYALHARLYLILQAPVQRVRTGRYQPPLDISMRLVLTRRVLSMATVTNDAGCYKRRTGGITAPP